MMNMKARKPWNQAGQDSCKMRPDINASTPRITKLVNIILEINIRKKIFRFGKSMLNVTLFSQATAIIEKK